MNPRRHQDCPTLVRPDKTGDGFKKNILISAQFGKKKAEKEFQQKDISMQGCINAATFYILFCWYLKVLFSLFFLMPKKYWKHKPILRKSKQWAHEASRYLHVGMYKCCHILHPFLLVSKGVVFTVFFNAQKILKA